MYHNGRKAARLIQVALNFSQAMTLITGSTVAPAHSVQQCTLTLGVLGFLAAACMSCNFLKLYCREGRHRD